MILSELDDFVPRSSFETLLSMGIYPSMPQWLMRTFLYWQRKKIAAVHLFPAVSV
jgi:hypothetical protein